MKIKQTALSLFFLLPPTFLSGGLPQKYNSDTVLGLEQTAVSDVPQVTRTRTTCNTTSVISSTTYSTPSSLDQQANIGYRNNKFGIYTYDVLDLVERAGDLVNSNGGEWGYVLIPYNVKDNNYDKWRGIFSSLTERKLIPIIQLWDVDLENAESQTVKAADFLNTFDWPIKNRYVSVYNEPNDERFWQGKLDPEGYARVLDYSIQTFKSQNQNFYLLNGAFNATAPNGGGYMDEVDFMTRMDAEVPGIFKKLDGWASHSYPQPAYRGSVYGVGRSSIKAYAWELDVLQNYFGVADLP